MRSGSIQRLKLAYFITAATMMALAHNAQARTERGFRYEPAKVWATALRFVRVNENLAVIDKDAEAGFILFEVREEKKIYRGSLEILTVTEQGRSFVRFVIQIADKPSYLEIAMMDRLERKLRDELGLPSPAPSPPPKNVPAPAVPQAPTSQQ
jgi:hypothetical protein